MVARAGRPPHPSRDADAAGAFLTRSVLERDRLAALVERSLDPRRHPSRAIDGDARSATIPNGRHQIAATEQGQLVVDALDVREPLGLARDDDLVATEQLAPLHVSSPKPGPSVRL